MVKNFVSFPYTILFFIFITDIYEFFASVKYEKEFERAWECSCNNDPSLRVAKRENRIG
jgi:hypothetical protein